jgi:MFS family permease
MVPFLTDSGLSPYAAASLLSLSAGSAIGGKFLFGVIADRSNARRALWLSMAIQLAGLGLFMTLRSLAGLGAAAVVFGLGMGGVVPLQSMFVAEAVRPLRQLSARPRGVRRDVPGGRRCYRLLGPSFAPDGADGT